MKKLYSFILIIVLLLTVCISAYAEITGIENQQRIDISNITFKSTDTVTQVLIDGNDVKAVGPDSENVYVINATELLENDEFKAKIDSSQGVDVEIKTDNASEKFSGIILSGADASKPDSKSVADVTTEKKQASESKSRGGLLTTILLIVLVIMSLICVLCISTVISDVEKLKRTIERMGGRKSDLVSGNDAYGEPYPITMAGIQGNINATRSALKEQSERLNKIGSVCNSINQKMTGCNTYQTPQNDTFVYTPPAPQPILSVMEKYNNAITRREDLDRTLGLNKCSVKITPNGIYTIDTSEINPNYYIEESGQDYLLYPKTDIYNLSMRMIYANLFDIIGEGNTGIYILKKPARLRQNPALSGCQLMEKGIVQIM